MIIYTMKLAVLKTFALKIQVIIQLRLLIYFVSINNIIILKYFFLAGNRRLFLYQGL